MKFISVNVKMNLKQVERYLEAIRSGRIKKVALGQIVLSLNKHLWNFVFTDSLADIYEIPDAATMINMIKTKTYPPLGSYNPEYLERMIRHGLKTHGSLREHTHIEIMADKVVMFIPSIHTTRTRVVGAFRRSIDTMQGAGPYGTRVHVYNFGPIHERRKSILKATIVFAWQDILKKVKNTYLSFATRV